MKTDPRLLSIRTHASDNEIEILQSKTCSCFFCRQTYDARKVNDWINDERGVTAICPECGMDAVIGDASGLSLDKDLLKEMNLVFYGEDYMEKHPLAAKKYVDRYKQNKITHKAANEALYIQYLYLLASKGDEDAAYDLADLYENGSEFTAPDAKTAFSYYAMDCLKKDGDALTRLGVLSENGSLGKADPQGAYECYAKAMAVGSLGGLIHFTDCYSKGIFVPKDEEFAFQCLSEIWPDSYSRFISSSGKDINIFPDASYRLGVMFMDSSGTKGDHVMALKLFLYAEFGYGLLLSANLLKGELIQENEDCEKRISLLGKEYHLTKQDPVFDNDTFADSLEVENETIKELPENYVFSPISYDKDARVFDFDITYAFPPLIVDVGNLYCGFVPDTIRWSFVDVADVKFTKESVFEHVNGNPDDGWQFVHGSDDNAESIAQIVFSRPSKKRSIHSKKALGKA